MSPTTDLLGFGEGREEGPHQQKDGGGTEMLEHGPAGHHLWIPCHMHPNMVSRQVWWVRHTPGTGTLLCVIGSVCGFTFSDEV